MTSNLTPNFIFALQNFRNGGRCKCTGFKEIEFLGCLDEGNSQSVINCANNFKYVLCSLDHFFIMPLPCKLCLINEVECRILYNAISDAQEL